MLPVKPVYILKEINHVTSDGRLVILLDVSLERTKLPRGLLFETTFVYYSHPKNHMNKPLLKLSSD